MGPNDVGRAAQIFGSGHRAGSPSGSLPALFSGISGLAWGQTVRSKAGVRAHVSWPLLSRIKPWKPHCLMDTRKTHLLLSYSARPTTKLKKEPHSPKHAAQSGESGRCLDPAPTPSTTSCQNPLVLNSKRSLCSWHTQLCSKWLRGDL